MTTSYDAIVIGSGPNGLAAAIQIALAGRSVCVLEANETIGGGARSAELTLPGFIHDICSAVHPLAAGSPFFSRLPLEQHGLKFVYPPVSLAHPFDDGSVVTLERSVKATSERLMEDTQAYQKLFGPLVERWDDLAADVLGPPRFPRHLLPVAQFGWLAIRSARGLAQSRFSNDKSRAVFAGLAAHSFLSLERLGTAGFGLMLGAMAHSVGWPIGQGGSQNITNALVSYLRELGGEVVTNHRVASLRELPSAKAIICDLTPRQVIHVAGDSLPASFLRKLGRYRYGPGAFKLDWALSSPSLGKLKSV
ncbi:MAG TPA: NAD(P)/FAD-dependent oxidoreductase [Pyrinomonadaceae bacterium]|nr:NAD(P)/FAD-dependent oxidoreductase [Pyrinomonadaceae bacterium]